MDPYQRALELRADRDALPMPEERGEALTMVTEKIPCVFIYLSVGYRDERNNAPAYNPKVRFHADVCLISAACPAHCAVRWLENRQTVTCQTGKVG